MTCLAINLKSNCVFDSPLNSHLKSNPSQKKFSAKTDVIRWMICFEHYSNLIFSLYFLNAFSASRLVLLNVGSKLYRPIIFEDAIFLVNPYKSFVATTKITSEIKDRPARCKTYCLNYELSFHLGRVRYSIVRSFPARQIEKMFLTYQILLFSRTC